MAECGLLWGRRMTCYAHVSWQYVFANRSWPHAESMVSAGLAMQNKTTGFMCANPDDQGTDHESPQCRTVCTAETPCTTAGCCGSVRHSRPLGAAAL